MSARVIPLTLRQANDFVEQHHRHSARTAADGGKFAIGLKVDGALVGVAIVGRPIARLLNSDGTAEVLRCCVTPEAPAGSCSRLYQRCARIWQLMGGERIVTYTLIRETGGSLRGAGWDHVADTRPKPWNNNVRERIERVIYGEPKRRWERQLGEVPA